MTISFLSVFPPHICHHDVMFVGRKKTFFSLLHSRKVKQYDNPFLFKNPVIEKYISSCIRLCLLGIGEVNPVYIRESTAKQLIWQFDKLNVDKFFKYFHLWIIILIASPPHWNYIYLMLIYSRSVGDEWVLFRSVVFLLSIFSFQSIHVFVCLWREDHRNDVILFFFLSVLFKSWWIQRLPIKQCQEWTHRK